MSIFETIRDLRSANAEALRTVLTSAEDFSESAILNAWLKRISNLEKIALPGWYIPPLEGAAILIGTQPNYTRINYHSLRDRDQLPRDTVHPKEDWMMYAYSSPVSNFHHLLGDVGVTLCRTESRTIRKHVREVLSLTVQAAQSAEEGMMLRDVYRQAAELFRAAGLTNQIYSVTDPHHQDIGHTLPWSYGEAPSPAELEILAGPSEGAARLISSKRMFLNKQSELIVRSPMAFTIEPRLSREDLPAVSFHLTVVFENGRRSIAAGFKPLLEHFGMTAWLDPKDLQLLDEHF